jgi:hypothetical protein
VPAMGINAFVAALSADWPRVLAQLPAEGRARLVELARRFDAEETERARTKVAHAMAGLLLDHLPDDDPVCQAFNDTRLIAVQLSSVRWFSLNPETEDDSPRQRILRTPMALAHEMRSTGADPDAADLIRLTRADGSWALPRFQFDPTERPIPLVLRINHLLDAETDPWGVSDWWLSPNPWLCGVPAELLGRATDIDLVAAAVAAVEG